LCLPPDDGHLAEWQQNLSSVLRFTGDDGAVSGDQGAHRQLLRQHIESFEGGFVTSGEVAEGMNLAVAEGWRGDVAARHFIAFAALPDGHTVVGLEYSRNAAKRSYLAELKGLHYAFANDLYNRHERRLFCAGGEKILRSPALREEIVALGGRWANIENRVGVAGLYGADELALHRVPQRRGGQFHSLFTEELCFPCELATRAALPDEVLLDIGWMALSDVDAAQTARAAANAVKLEIEGARAVQVVGQDGRAYAVIFNIGSQAVQMDTLGLSLQETTAIEPGVARVCVVDG
jgi:hypothetical protein